MLRVSDNISETEQLEEKLDQDSRDPWMDDSLRAQLRDAVEQLPASTHTPLTQARSVARAV